MRIEGAHEDVQIRGVVGDLRFAAETRLGVFGWAPFADGRGHVGWGGVRRVAAAGCHRQLGRLEETDDDQHGKHDPACRVSSGVSYAVGWTRDSAGWLDTRAPGRLAATRNPG